MESGLQHLAERFAPPQRSGDKTKEATEVLKLTAQDLKNFDVIDEIIPEPLGGAHRKPEVVFENLRKALRRYINQTINLDADEIKRRRTEKFLDMTRHLKQIPQTPNKK